MSEQFGFPSRGYFEQHIFYDDPYQFQNNDYRHHHNPRAHGYTHQRLHPGMRMFGGRQSSFSNMSPHIHMAPKRLDPLIEILSSFNYPPPPRAGIGMRSGMDRMGQEHSGWVPFDTPSPMGYRQRSPFFGASPQSGALPQTYRTSPYRHYGYSPWSNPNIRSFRYHLSCEDDLNGRDNYGAFSLSDSCGQGPCDPRRSPNFAYGKNLRSSWLGDCEHNGWYEDRDDEDDYDDPLYMRRQPRY